ncbi:MAG: aureolysin [Thermoleophilia bacterium]|nr:aureolysin [Thermoleophilia bacterium]
MDSSGAQARFPQQHMINGSRARVKENPVRRRWRALERVFASASGGATVWNANGTAPDKLTWVAPGTAPPLILGRDMGMTPVAASALHKTIALTGTGVAVAALGGTAAAVGTLAASEQVGTPAQLGKFAGMPVVSGAAAGLVGATLLGFTKVGKSMPVLKFLAVPAGIGGAFAGAQVGAGIDQSRNGDRYASYVRDAHADVDRTRDMFRAAGASEDAIETVPLSYDARYFNASFHPEQPGNDQAFIKIGRSPTSGIPLLKDVVSHEFAHKVVHELAPNLGYDGEGGALHESLADTFAAATDTDDWLVGEDSFPPDGIRSLADPGREGPGGGQPTKRSEIDPNGEVHLNAGIGNKVACHIGEALGRDTMAQLYVTALGDPSLDADAGYVELASALRSAAVQNFGAASEEARVVDEAWNIAEYDATEPAGPAPTSNLLDDPGAGAARLKTLDPNDVPDVIY